MAKLAPSTTRELKIRSLEKEMRQGELERVSDSKMNSFLNKEISFEGKILLMINFADTLNTAFSIQPGLAVELNPIMKLLLKHGTPTFVTSKIAIIATLILALKLLRSARTHKRLVRFSQWAAIIALPSAILLANFLFPYLKILWRLG